MTDQKFLDLNELFLVDGLFLKWAKLNLLTYEIEDPNVREFENQLPRMKLYIIQKSNERSDVFQQLVNYLFWIY